MTAELWTAPTPNGWKVSIMWEELREAGIDLPALSVHTVKLQAAEQFTPEYTAINPNQKIPTLVHQGRSIMESCAILAYLGEAFPSHLLPLGADKWSVMQWVFWQAANLGPNFGNKLSYTRYMDDVSDAAKAHPLERFTKESLRLTSVLSRQLGDQAFICGDQFTIADIAIYPWVRGWKWSKVDITRFTNVMNWVDRVRARPGVARGLEYGIDKSEVDGWSDKTKASYAHLGSSIANNQKLRTEQ